MTRLLRRGQPDELERELVAVLRAGGAEWNKDERDLMMALAPYHDCARRLGADVAALFGRAAQAGPPELREVVESFGARTDVLPETFGFEVESTPQGPRYRWPGPSAAETIEVLRRAGFLDPDHDD